jgi:hypothetical protein
MAPPNCLPLTSSADSSAVYPDRGEADGVPTAKDSLPKLSSESGFGDLPTLQSFVSPVKRLRNFALARFTSTKTRTAEAKEESSLARPNGLLRRLTTGLNLSLNFGGASSSSRVSPSPSRSSAQADRPPIALEESS